VYRALATLLTDELELDHAARVRDFLLAHPRVRSGPIGSLGFNVGGRFAMMAAA
jgi:dienelactone hydrolase